MRSGVNSYLLAGLGVGTGIVVAGFTVASLIYPPAPATAPQPGTFETSTSAPDPVAPGNIDADRETTGISPTEEIIATAPPATDPPVPEASDAEMAVEVMPDPTPSEETLPTEDAQAPTPPEDSTLAEIAQAPLLPDDPADAAELAEELAPIAPGQERERAQARLPSGLLAAPWAERSAGLPQVLAPDAPAPDADTPVASAAPEPEQSDAASLDAPQPATLPGQRISNLPQIGTGDTTTVAQNDVPEMGAADATALERNALHDGSGTGARMALVLSDPGLPMAMRRSLAAMDFPFTVALNPLDTTAPDAAGIYRENGKEVLILATAIPAGATASDLDVTFSAYFSALPTAVGVIDLPQSGFARNAGLLSDVLPLLAEDGHGLVTFSGGLAQAARAADAAGIAHAEVFRVLDSGNDSAFTMRRFLDRAVFQASQMGQVVVFGDGSNDVLMEAIAMWREGSRLDQVELVPISGILLQQQ